MKLVVVYILIIFLPSKLFSQHKLSGVIVDKNGYGIEFAEILLSNTAAKIEKITLSNRDGSFEIDISNGVYKLDVIINTILKVTQQLDISRNTNLENVVIEDEIILSEVLVQAHKPLFKRDIDKIIFIVENSTLNNGYNVMEVLQRSPKIKVDSQGAISLKNGIATVQLNGRKLNLSSTELKNYLGNIESESIKQIEIQANTSAESDANSEGGVINIVTNKKQKGLLNLNKLYVENKQDGFLKHQLGSTLLYGSENWNLYSRLNYNIDEDIGIVRSTANYYSNQVVQVNEGYFIENNKNISFAQGLVIYPNKKDEIGMEFYLNSKNRDVDSNKNLKVKSHNVLELLSENISFLDSNQDLWYTTFNYNKLIDSLGSNIKFIGDFGENKLSNSNNTNTNYSFGNRQNSTAKYNTKGIAKYNTLQFDLKKNTLSMGDFSLGIKNIHVTRNNILLSEFFEGDDWNIIEDLQYFQNRENVFAGYMSYGKKWLNNNIIKVGLRTENTNIKGVNTTNIKIAEDNYTDFFPSIYYGYDFREDRYLSFSYTKNILRPSFNSLNPFVQKLDDFYYQKGNPNLKAQYSNKIDLSYQLQRHDFSVYLNFVNALIAPAYNLTSENIRIYQVQNFGNERSFGISYDYSGNLNKWLYVNFALNGKYYDFQSRSGLESSNISFVNNIYTTIQLNNSISIDLLSIYFSDFQYHLVEDLGSYRMDISVQKKFWDEKGLIKLSVFDVFNSMNASNTSYYEDLKFDFFQKKLTQSIAFYISYKIGNNKKINDKSVRSDNESRRRL